MAVYLLGLAAIKVLVLGEMRPITIVPPDGRAAAVIAPLSWTYFYYIAVFSFGLSGDLAARQSIFPARMFALPVPTRTLVLVPMVYGMATVTALCLATALLARWPWGLDVPLLSPALLAAVYLAWTQALMWMPYGLPGVRVIVTVLWLVALDVVALLAIHFRVSEPVMLAILVPQLPLAYLVARVAVARARRGDVPEWRVPFAWLSGLPDAPSRGRGSFSSRETAQAWFEWRRHGRSLPVFMAILLPFELALLWIARGAPALVVEILLGVLLTPPLMAAFAGTSVSGANPHARDSYGVMPFVATRPLTSAALIVAKLRAAMWSTLAAWLLVLVAVPVALVLSGNWPTIVERASRVVDVFGMPRAVVIAVLVVAGLLVFTWKQLVQSLFIGLTGRVWLIRSSVVAALVLVVCIGPVAQWLADHKRAQAALWDALPSILALLVGLKLLAAAWVAVRLQHSALLGEGTLVAGTACWVAVVFALYGVLAWLVSGPLIPRYFLLLVAILAIPFARLFAAPLALAWNRHR